MKILITGATGLVGSELVARLLKNGYAVHYLTTSRSKMENQTNYKGFFWDPQRGMIDENCLMGVQCIIHLAGASISSRWTAAYKQEILESRVLSANLLYKAVKDYPNEVSRIISASAIGIYPDDGDNLYTEEDTQTDDSFLAGVVEKWERSIDRFDRIGIPSCKLRTGLVLSDKGGALPQFVKPVRMGFGTHFGSGRQMQSWIHVKDMAAMYLYAVENKWQGIYNAVAPHPVSQKQLVSAIASKLQKPLWLPGIPKFLMSALLGDMHELLFAGQHVSANKALQAGFVFEYPHIEQALDDLLG